MENGAAPPADSPQTCFDDWNRRRRWPGTASSAACASGCNGDDDDMDVASSMTATWTGPIDPFDS